MDNVQKLISIMFVPGFKGPDTCMLYSNEAEVAVLLVVFRNLTDTNAPLQIELIVSLNSSGDVTSSNDKKIDILCCL